MTMLRRIPRFASTRGLAWACGLALLAASVGCKGKDRNSGGPSGNFTGNDPLLAGPGRIPRQNVPVPGRDGTAGGGKRGDPLLGSPTSGTRANSDADRWKNGPYLPGPGDSPAALAGNRLNDGEGLAIELPGGEKLTPAGGAAPVRPERRTPEPAAPIGSDAAFGELAKYGVKRGDYAVSREDGVFVVRVKVSAADGPARGLTGQGGTEAAAVKQIIDQLK
jgi:hypothetical protein